MRTTLLCAVLLILTSAPATFAASPVTFFSEQKVPLLYQIMQTTPTSPAPGAFPLFSRQVYVFRDGTVAMSIFGAQTEGSLPPTGGILSGQAPEVQMKGLNDALAAAQVGVQEDCYLELRDEFLETWHFRYTWFGRGNRENTFQALDTPELAPCPGEIKQLQDSLQFLIIATPLTTFLGH